MSLPEPPDPVEAALGAEEYWPTREQINAWLGDTAVGTGEPDAERLARARAFRDVLGRFCTGVTVVTGAQAGVPLGLTCQSFTSVSLDPPLVLFCPSKTSRAWPLILQTGAFCVNLLAADQWRVSEVMATKGADKFADVPWIPSPVTGSPWIGGSLGYVDCRVHAVHDGGDHDVVLGRVEDLALNPSVRGALLFHEGRYRVIRD